MKFEIGEIILVIKDIPNEEISVPGTYLKRGTKLRITDVESPANTNQQKAFYKVIDITNNKLFAILHKDIQNEFVISLSKMRDDKINKILE